MKQNPPMVIVGCGGAAINALQGARLAGYQGDIHLFSDHMDPPYNPMLTTYFLTGKISADRCCPFGSGFAVFKRNAVNFHPGSPVTRVNPEEKTVLIASSEKLTYKTCLVATGASAVVPHIPGIDNEHVYYLRTLAEAKRLRGAYLRHPKRVLIMGASMVGVKLIEAFHAIGSHVYVADLAPQVLPLSAHPGIADIMHEELSQRGIELLLNAKVTRIEQAPHGINVSFAGSTPQVNVDLVVVCVGVKANLDSVRGAKIEVDKGIIVDRYMQTNQENVYAAGDVAQATNLLSGNKEIIGLWANACLQGRIAGANMAGKKVSYPGSIPQNITHFLDMFFVSIGDTRGQGRVFPVSAHWELTTHTRSWACVFEQGGQPVGANLLTFHAGELLDLIGEFRYQIFRNCRVLRNGGTGLE